MDIKNLMSGAQSTPGHLFKRNLNTALRTHSKFKNLDQKNRELITNKVMDYRERYLKKGRSVPSETLRRDMYDIRKNRLTHGMTHEDIKDMEDIMSEFK